MKKFATCAALGLCLALTACGDGPSDGDVKAAIRTQMKAVLGLFGNNAAASNALNQLEIVVGDKTKQPDGSYAVIATIKKAGGYSDTETVIMLHGADGWVVRP